MVDRSLLPTDKDVEFWKEKGYWVSGKVLSDAQIEKYRNAMYRLWAAEFDTGKEPWGGPWRLTENASAIRKMDQAHWASGDLRELATNETVGAIAARLGETEAVRLWHDQLLYKPGNPNSGKGAGGNVGWHQDHYYWKCTTQDLFTAWVALDDVTVENGCMQMVPGSHKWGVLDGNFFEQDLDKLKADIERESGQKFETVPIEMKAGQVSFHHCLTIHGSGPNVTTRPRRSLVLHLMPNGAHYVAGSPCDNHMNAILMQRLGGKDGDRFEGDLWPLLYSESPVAAGR